MILIPTLSICIERSWFKSLLHLKRIDLIKSLSHSFCLLCLCLSVYHLSMSCCYRSVCLFHCSFSSSVYQYLSVSVCLCLSLSPPSLSLALSLSLSLSSKTPVVLLQNCHLYTCDLSILLSIVCR